MSLGGVPQSLGEVGIADDGKDDDDDVFLANIQNFEFALKGSGVLCSITTQPCDLKHYGFKKSSCTFSRARVAG